MSASVDDDGFEPHRAHLRGLAYRMLGSQAEAEDAVQETWLRWHGSERAAVENPRAFLSRIVTRLCLDRLNSAQAQRETYVGPWLPEPLLDDALLQPGPEAETELASDVSFAFMLALERLSPLERAAFLLHDVFDLDYTDIAASLGRGEAACRQLAARARANLRTERPRFRLAPDRSEQLAGAFLQALQGGDVAGLTRLLAEDTRFIADGGGRVPAVGTLLGRVRVAETLSGFARKGRPLADARFDYRLINGLPGFLVSHADGRPMQTMALEFGDDGQLQGIYVVRNPDKLTRATH